MKDVVRKPRVLQVALSLNPGGTERLIVELATRLHAEVPMMVCCLDEAGAWAPDVQAHGIEVRALGRRSGFSLSLGRQIATMARDHAATVIHAHHYSPFVYSALARCWRPNVSVIFTEHGRLSDAPASPKRRLANRLLARLPREVYAVSENLKQHIIGEGWRQDAVGVIHNGIDVGPPPDEAGRTRARQALNASGQTLVIGTIARLDPVKDLGMLLRATARVARERPVLLAILGDGPERQSLERLAAELGLDEHVRFLGHRDDARTWLAGCDVYVNSSISEGVSLTILEAMAAGLPVVATRVGGTPEVVDESCGRLIPPREPSTLAQTLLILGKDPGLRAALGQAARRRVETRFTIDRMVGEYRDAYYRVG